MTGSILEALQAEANRQPEAEKKLLAGFLAKPTFTMFTTFTNLSRMIESSSVAWPL